MRLLANTDLVGASRIDHPVGFDPHGLCPEAAAADPVQLARRVRLGDAGAAEQFRREMTLALEGMVRLALRKRICFSPFEEYARAEADRLQESSDRQLPMHELARRTACELCQDMIDRLQTGGRLA